MTRRNLSHDESGTALLIAIVLATILGVLASVVALTARMEILIAGRFEQGQQLGYAADGALALALADLRSADWTAALGGAQSSFAEGAPDRVVTLTSAIQQAANGGRQWGLNTPQWRLYAWGPVTSWLGEGIIRAPFYAAVWIADDPSDNDGDPVTDANQVIAVYAVALGPGGGQRGVRAVVARPLDPAGEPLPQGVRILSWHETRW